MTGRIHSIQTMGAVDGPGIRGVVFFQGCPLRCAYCHNPDTWDASSGMEISAEALCQRLLRYRSYYKRGGVTASGGEPLLQSEFCAELFERLHAEGLHTALDTSGVASPEAARRVLAHTDLVLCDLKFVSSALYLANTGMPMEPVMHFLRETEVRNIPLWIRHVVVPGLTASDDEVLEMARIARTFRNLQKIELLPFKKLCQTKYNALQIPFPLTDVPECPSGRIDELYALLDQK